MRDKEKITLSFIIGEHEENQDRIIIAFDGTGLNVNDAKHKHFLEILAGVMASQMYAKANDIPIENVVVK